jgi:hypothetical protein
MQRRVSRKQIGKFGIGKLATHTIANKVTYISRSQNQILSVTLARIIHEPNQARHGFGSFQAENRVLDGLASSVARG